MSFASEFKNFLSVDKKEQCLKEVLKVFRGQLDSMEVQDMLLRYDWDTKKVIDYFKKRQPKVRQPVQREQPKPQPPPQNYYPQPDIQQQQQQVYQYPPQQGYHGYPQSQIQPHPNYYSQEAYPAYQQSYPGCQEQQAYSYQPPAQYYNYNQPNYSYPQPNYSYGQQNYQNSAPVMNGNHAESYGNGNQSYPVQQNVPEPVPYQQEVAQPATPQNAEQIKHENNSETDDTPIKSMKTNKRRIPDTPDESEKVNGFANGNSNDSSENSSQQYSQKKKKARNNSSSDDGEAPKQPVFNSDDDSDYDYTEFMTKDKKEVYEFFNTATINELTAIKACSSKKAEVIIENRPYRNWHDLKLKFQSTKPLNPELLNSAQEYMNRRNSLKTIMKKCKNIVAKLEAAVEDGANITKQPSLLNPNLNLSEYQMVGLNWLAVIHQNAMNGILADEMGLGKTIQIIAFLAWLKETGRSENTHLIIVPSSTLDNWANELEKWCPSLRVIKYYGSQEERKMLRIQYAKNGLQNLFDVMLTTYHVVGATGEEKKMFRVTQMHYVIFDEAHMLKNMQTARYATLLRINAKRRILLTGTPLQNNLLELMSLLCFVMPSLFHGKTEDIKALFTKRMPKLDDTADSATPFEQSQIERAKNIMKPFILRRLKKDVLTFLPQKTDHLVKVKLAEDQKKKYQQLINEYKDLKEMAMDPLTDVSGSTIMMDMRKLSNHPLLLRYYFTDAKVMEIARVLARDSVYKNNNAREIFEDIAPLSDFKIYQLSEKYQSITSLVKLPDQLVCSSGKFKYFDEMLPKLKKDGHRVLIFSQFVMMLDVIEKYLAVRGHQFVRLDGSTAVTDRQDLIEEYTRNDEIFIFLLSTRAGGLGINLTAADTAIIHDIDFNPYNDKQAEDRCHRIGQTKEVTIYKLISEGTIEEGMSLIASEKLKLEKEVTSEVDSKEEHKCMVKLLTMSLGLETDVAEVLLSPKKEHAPNDGF